MDTLVIRDDSIRLGQALKLHGVAEDGVMAKELIVAGQVQLNGAVETRRGATVVLGDQITVSDLGVAFTVARA